MKTSTIIIIILLVILFKKKQQTPTTINYTTAKLDSLAMESLEKRIIALENGETGLA